MLQTTGSVTNSLTSDFQHATFLNEVSEAVEVLYDLLGPGGWYPENEDEALADIAVLDGEYYAAFGIGSVSSSGSKCTYVQVVPTPALKEVYGAIQKGQ